MAKLLADVAATPKGQKKDISKAAAKAYNPRIVETAWCVGIQPVQTCIRPAPMPDMPDDN